MILMPQIFDVVANENARYKRYELDSLRQVICVEQIHTSFSRCHRYP